jgi:hypothetical protein
MAWWLGFKKSSTPALRVSTTGKSLAPYVDWLHKKQAWIPAFAGMTDKQTLGD